MADTAPRVGQANITPPNVTAGMTYSPLLESSANHVTSYPAGTPVCPAADGSVLPARANTLSTSQVSGLLATPGAVGQHAPALPTGSILHLTTDQWDVITGGSGGLIVSQRYYLSAASPEGRITATPPSAPGQFVAPLGLGLSPTDMAIQICCPTEIPDNNG